MISAGHGRLQSRRVRERRAIRLRGDGAADLRRGARALSRADTQAAAPGNVSREPGFRFAPSGLRVPRATLTEVKRATHHPARKDAAGALTRLPGNGSAWAERASGQREKR